MYKYEFMLETALILWDVLIKTIRSKNKYLVRYKINEY